ARRCWRTRVLFPRPWPRESGAAQRLEFFGEHAALVAPRLLLVAFARDDLSRGARDEVLVGELGRERGELLIEPRHLAGEAAASSSSAPRPGIFCHSSSVMNGTTGCSTRSTVSKQYASTACAVSASFPCSRGFTASTYQSASSFQAKS